MVFKIVWTPIGLETYLQVVDYLEKEWSEKEVNNFAKLVETASPCCLSNLILD